MKKYTLFLITTLVLCQSVFGKSFLTAQSFPKTFNDLSFVERMRIEAEGFRPYESEYDSKGVCIKNCAYAGITIKQEEEQSIINTQNAVQKSLQYEQNQKVNNSAEYKQNITDKNSAEYKQNIKNNNYAEYGQNIQNLPVDTQKIISANNALCMYRNSSVQSGASVPRAEPLTGTPRISSSFGRRIHPFSGNNSFHNGIDYAVPVGTMVYTPADGKVTKVKNDANGYGWYVVVQHPDRTSTLYAHLSEVLVSVGDNVSAGCAVAKSGNTGRSTGPHLHYGMLDANNNYIDPSKYTGRAN